MNQNLLVLTIAFLSIGFLIYGLLQMEWALISVLKLL